MPRWFLPLVVLGMALWAIIVLERDRSGVMITHFTLSDTPVTEYVLSDKFSEREAPAVVMAHGFAGSRQIMQGYTLLLAQAGYRVFAFDFEGHGQHPRPMSGDVTSVDGTTRLLVAQTHKVLAHAARGGAPVTLVGHSMATDILVRAAQSGSDIGEDVGPLVLISPFSQAITATHPKAALLLPGAWEGRLADFALEAVQMVDPTATLGETARAGDVIRRGFAAPYAEHVAVLHSKAARSETLSWLNQVYGRAETPPVRQTGWALVALLAAITLLAPVAARLLPQSAPVPAPLPWRSWALVAVAPAVVTPFLAMWIDLQTLPVLVADDLAVHFAIYGVVQLGLLLWLGRGFGSFRALQIAAALVLVLWALGTFGVALHRYGANFWPNPPRFGLIAALCFGALPFMLADARLAFGAPLWQRIGARGFFFLSLALAVALDFEGLFFLILIAPIMVLFFLTFGSMGRAFAKRCGPVSAGLGLGLVLAWSLGVSFPLFAA